MFFYGVFTKVGSAVAGWVNGNYPKKESVQPRVYHKYLKKEDKERLYPNRDKADSEAEKEEEPVVDETSDQEVKSDETPDTDEDPMANS